MKTSLAICSAILLAGCMGEAPIDESEEAVQGELAPSGRGFVTRDANAGKKPGGGTSGIQYHGGPVMLGTVNVYYIWYGNWSGNTRDDDPHRLRQQPRRLAATSNINTTYYDGSNNHVSATRRTTRGSTTDNYSQGTSLVRRADPDRRVDRDLERAPAEGHQRRLLRAHLGRRQRDERASARSTAAGTRTAPSRAPTSSTRSSATRTAARRRARRRRPARTATPAPTAWRRSSRTSSRRRSPIPTSTPGTTAAAQENADKCAWTFGTTYDGVERLAGQHHARRQPITSSSRTG